MFMNRRNRRQPNPFQLVEVPDFTHEVDGFTIKLYFFDSYDWKEEMMKHQLFFMDRKPKEFSVLIEKRVYDLIPDYFSKNSLEHIGNYFHRLNSTDTRLLAVGGVVLTMVTVVALNALFSNLLLATVGGFGLGILYMIFVLFKKLQKNMYNSRIELRTNLVNLFGAEKLDSMLDTLDKYIAQRTKELS